MISSIFGKTKPINHIIVLSFLFLFYWMVNFFVFGKTYTPNELFPQTLVLGILTFSFFVVNFIVKRNKITGQNSFAIVLYTMLIVVFPEVLVDNNAILCNFFLLLGLRRLISIKSLKNIKLKIFDATLWICVASLFYDMALIFILLVFIAIYFYEPKNIRNWMVPFIGVFTVLMIVWALLILAGQEGFLMAHYTFSFEFDKGYFLNLQNSAKLIIYAVIVFVASLFTFIRMGKAGIGRIATMRLIVLFFILGILLKVLKTSSGTYPIIITFFPAVVFFTNYIEAIKKPNIKEVVLILSIVIPFIIFFSGLAMR
ncbi:DUF6427 family protein [Costertonia aggregata]|uniref:Uncharacterized protein n=1 Tax=Costertonia aggregata TaxID=343403 RepID=A0A7H9AP65_9FLAO|nr:DUF6427 family protein [Costertonia aggregata]QLG45232.1 hypothetical protein HYG79_07695 [Costertonia aggregata]